MALLAQHRTELGRPITVTTIFPSEHVSLQELDADGTMRDLPAHSTSAPVEAFIQDRQPVVAPKPRPAKVDVPAVVPWHQDIAAAGSIGAAGPRSPQVHVRPQSRSL